MLGRGACGEGQGSFLAPAGGSIEGCITKRVVVVLEGTGSEGEGAMRLGCSRRKGSVRELA